MVELDRCNVELVTENNYQQYITTVDGSLDVFIKGGVGPDGMDKEEQLQSVPATQMSHDNSDGHNTTLNAPFEEDEPTLELLSQVAHVMTGHQPNSDGNNKPPKPLRHQTAWKRTANSTKPSKKHQTTERHLHLMHWTQKHCQQLSQEKTMWGSKAKLLQRSQPSQRNNQDPKSLMVLKNRKLNMNYCLRH